jgi:uncharacterized protein YcfJ
MNAIAKSAWAAMAAVVLAASPVDGARADSTEAYCHDYADDYARSRTGGNALGGAFGGAAAGAILGAIIDGGRGAGRGALIGGGTGLIFGAIGEAHGYEQAYDRAFDDCIREHDRLDNANQAVYNNNQTGYQSGGYQGAAPEPWTDAWYDYCSAKYRSFDADSGYYLAYSGTYRFCQ